MGLLYHGYVKLPEGILAMENKKWKMAKSWQILVNGKDYPIYEMENKIHV